MSALQPSVMQEHLNNFEWAAITNMKNNLKKCASMNVSFLMNNQQEPPLTISNIPLQVAQVAKILGIISVTILDGVFMWLKYLRKPMMVDYI